MLSKVIIFFVVVAVVHSAPEPQHEQPARYPAGVNPALCPGFPICDNAVLHGTAPQHASPIVARAWDHQPQQQWNPIGLNHIGHPSAHSWNNIVQTHTDHIGARGWDQWNNAAGIHGPITNDISGPGGDKYPAGVNPSACPNYPYCDTGVAVARHAPAVAPLPGWSERQYPAGVSPATCPNFPYCH